MSVNRNARASRKGAIPGSLVLKWKNPGPRGSKQFPRRPMTACQNCRTAKLKCDGRKDCERCLARGSLCIYTNAKAVDGSYQRDPLSQDDAMEHELVVDRASTEMSLGFGVTQGSHQFSMEGVRFGDTLENMGEWPNDTAHQQLDDFDWGDIDPNLNANLYDRSRDSVSGGLVSLIPATLSQMAGLGAQSAQLGLDLFQPLPDSATQTLTQTTPPDFITPNTLTPSPNRGLSPCSTLFSSSTCQCRDNLAILLPKVQNAIQEKQLDKVHRITRQVMQSCQNIIDCTGCQIGCNDLICIIAILQKTDVCFEYLAKADLHSAIRMSFGGTEVPINDPKLRAMLVMNLIQQATMVLDSLSIKGQDMLRALGTPHTLAQINIEYLETAIEDFRVVLRKAAELAS